MGLDSYFSETKDYKAIESPNYKICGGLCSGQGLSFRGKVYNDLIQDATGESLYQEWIPPKTVKCMAISLKGYIAALKSFSGERTYTDWELTLESIEELNRMFQDAASLNLGLIGWW